MSRAVSTTRWSLTKWTTQRISTRLSNANNPRIKRIEHTGAARAMSPRLIHSRAYRSILCPTCGREAGDPAELCVHCGSPVPVGEETSFYDYFRSSISPPDGPFQLDVRALRKDFLRQQQQVHPDKFTHDPEQRRRAESVSGQLNKAYSTLRDPLRRAEYLLERSDKQISEESKLIDPDVLSDVMEAREAVEDTSVPAELEDLLQVYQKRSQEEIRTLESAFAQNKLDMARGAAVRLKYWTNIERAIIEKL
ncbi:molecular chaperone [Savitreella phatthalungensis]